MNFNDIAHVVDAANRVLQAANGEEPSPPWDDAPGWMHAATLAGITGVLMGDTAAESHARFIRLGFDRHAAGGAAISGSYDELPEAQQVKDRVFRAIVLAIVGDAG